MKHNQASRKSHIWRDNKWVEVLTSDVPEHNHSGKPEDCDRCNAMLHYELSKLAAANADRQ
jgi:hypothetical protein